jgi:hypothetical protein
MKGSAIFFIILRLYGNGMHNGTAGTTARTGGFVEAFTNLITL